MWNPWYLHSISTFLFVKKISDTQVLPVHAPEASSQFNITPTSNEGLGILLRQYSSMI